jgi:multidrug efflux pump subunit AcrB
MRAVPGAAGVVGDQLMEHMDFVGADKVAKRLRSMLPDQIKAMEDEKITEAENPEAAALQAQLEQGKKAMQQMQQQGQALAQELEQLKKSKAADAEGKQLDNQTKQLELQVRMEEAKAKMVELQPTENKLEETQRQWDYDQQMQNDKQEHEAIQADADREMKQTDADNALQMQNDKQEHEAIQSDANRKIDLAKAIFNKSAAGNGELAMEDAVDQATMIVADGLSGDEAKYQHELMEQEKSAAMSHLVERLSDVIESNAKSAAPKRVVRDGNNMIVGLETIVEELN